jgi:hypothetical protein
MNTVCSEALCDGEEADADDIARDQTFHGVSSLTPGLSPQLPRDFLWNPLPSLSLMMSSREGCALLSDPVSLIFTNN